MIKPINGFVLVEPLVHDSFTVSDKVTYDEIGIVLASDFEKIPLKSKVYFDSFMARKYPNPDKPNDYFWLVNHEEIAAIEENAE